MGTPAGQYIPPAAREHIEKLVAESRAKPALKPVVAGKPNPNIGMGLQTPSDLPQFGEPGWVNPNYDLYHNADGYHRFDPKIVGMGMQMSRTYADGANAYDVYQQRSPNTMYARYSRQFLADNGIDPATATDLQKYASMDYAGRIGQWKNQRPKRKFGIKDAFGLALSVGAIFVGNPYLAVAMAGGGTALQGGDLGDIALSMGLTAAANVGGGKAGKALSTAAQAGNKTAQFVLKTLPLVKTGAQLAQTGFAIDKSINKSGVNLSPDQYSIRQGGNRKITTFEPENKNIAFDAHPTSAYAAAYPGLANVANVANAGTRPINAAPIAPINTSGRNAAPYAAPKPYVAPPRVQIASNIPIINYDPSRNYQSPTTMQQALMRPAATRAPSKNVTAA